MSLRRFAGRWPEAFMLVLFMAAYCVVTAFHEPWFDEAQAWQIAKYASLHDILFEVPHYEGHPPFWHLVLAIPAKLGVPFEVGLKGIGLLCFSASAMLILFKSPFPRPVRLVLPLTYFVFYQYGVVVRPYAFMLLLLLLLAWWFPTRLVRPVRYVVLLVLLCLTGAYGMLFACGIALCMTEELVGEKGFARTCREVVTDVRTRSLLVLLLVAILIVLLISPRPDTWVTSNDVTNPLWIRLAYVLLALLPDCFFTTSSWFMSDTILLQNAVVSLPELALLCVAGLVLWVLAFSISSKRTLPYLLVSYALFAAFCALVYMNGHHVGLMALYALFWVWIVWADEERFEVGRLLLVRMRATVRDQVLAKRIAQAAGIACLAVPLWWTAGSVAADATQSYSYGKDAAQFLQSNGLDEGQILSAWMSLDSEGKTADAGSPDELLEVSIPVVVNAYFDHNLCYNLNGGSDDEAYFHYRLSEKDAATRLIPAWKKQGVPDVLLGKADVDRLFDGELTHEDYMLAHVCEYSYVWKGRTDGGYEPIYVRKDRASELGLEPVEGTAALWTDGFKLTDEMREQYEAGVPIEEILNPYLDQMFGEN